MKRILVRFSMLAVLVATGSFLYLETPADASAVEMACWEQAYNKWMNCDTAYSNTLTQYDLSPTTCANSATTACTADANTYCLAQATSQCNGDPVCENTVFTGCYSGRYNSCYSAANTSCMANAQTAYNNRGTAYGSCLGIEGNFGNCIEQVDGGCMLAQDRVATCAALYQGIDNYDAYSTCITASGINRCV